MFTQSAQGFLCFRKRKHIYIYIYMLFLRLFKPLDMFFFCFCLVWCFRAISVGRFWRTVFQAPSVQEGMKPSGLEQAPLFGGFRVVQGLSGKNKRCLTVSSKVRFHRLCFNSAVFSFCVYLFGFSTSTLSTVRPFTCFFPAFLA